MRIALWMICFLIMCSYAIMGLGAFVILGSAYSFVVTNDWPPHTRIICAVLGVFAVASTIIVEVDRRRNG